MTAIAKSAKRHPAAKTCCGWEENAICSSDICPSARDIGIIDQMFKKFQAKDGVKNTQEGGG